MLNVGELTTPELIELLHDIADELRLRRMQESGEKYDGDGKTD